MKFKTKLLVTISFVLAAMGVRAQTPLPTGVKPVYPIWYISINATTQDTTWYVWGGAPYKALKLSKSGSGGTAFTAVSPLQLLNGNLQIVTDSTHRFVHDYQIAYWNSLQGGKVPYSGATQDVDLGSYEIYAGAAEIGGNKPGVYGAGIYNTASTGNGIFIKGGSLGYHNTDFIDYNNNYIAYLDGDGTFYGKGFNNKVHRVLLTKDSLAVPDKKYVDNLVGSIPPAGVPKTSNKGMAALTTTADNQLACSVGIASTPVNGGYVSVYVNGLLINVGDGVKTKDAYFSGDSGLTARSLNAIQVGDKLYWNGSIAGYQLSSTDLISFLYI